MTQSLSRDPSDPLFQPVSDRDPATPGDPLSRLRFHYGQCLSAEDFEAEQRYFVLRRRLHNALLHGVGTVWGLAIRRQEPPGEAGARLICEPGLAIDPLGREIWVLQPLCLDLAALTVPFWNQLRGPGGVKADPDNAASADVRRAYVVLSYEACLSDEVPVIPLPCGDDQDGLAPSRLRDSFRLCLEAEAPPDLYATVRDISRLPRPGTRPRNPRRGDRWRAPDSTIWTYDQPRNPDGTYRSDDPGTPEVESQLRWKQEPGVPAMAAPLLAPVLQGWRKQLLNHALNRTNEGAASATAPLERFWSGDDDVALLLATLDLRRAGPAQNNLQPVQLLDPGPEADNPDNRVRAVLPGVQALADLALGIRLEGPSAASAPFQVLGVTATAVDGGGDPISSGSGAVAIQLQIQLNERVLVDPDPANTSAALQQSVQLLRWDGTTRTWREVSASSTPETLTAWEVSSATEPPAIRLRVQPAWAASTTFQVSLKGTGPAALMADSSPSRPLAGIAGEGVPAGSGRDAHLFATYTPPTP